MMKGYDMNYDVEVRPKAQRYRGRYKVKPRVYVWPAGETIMENLINRRDRPLREFRSIMHTGLNKIGVDTAKLDIKWSQKAGCPCGCSPGFIVDGWDAKLDGCDVHITVEMV